MEDTSPIKPLLPFSLMDVVAEQILHLLADEWRTPKSLQTIKRGLRLRSGILADCDLVFCMKKLAADSLPAIHSDRCILPIKHVRFDAKTGNLLITLSRPHVIKTVMHDILLYLVNTTLRNSKKVFSVVHDVMHSIQTQDLSLMRTVLISNHARALLETAGGSYMPIHPTSSVCEAKLVKKLEKLDSHVKKVSTEDGNILYEIDAEGVLGALLTSTDLGVSSQLIVTQKHWPLVAAYVSALEMLEKTDEKDFEPSILLTVCTNQILHRHKVSAATAHIITALTDVRTQHVFISHNGVQPHSKIDGYDSLQRCYFKQALRAFQERRQANVDKETLERVAHACIQYDMLSLPPKSSVQLQRIDQSSFNSEMIFILYNYARIMSILTTFEYHISLKTYPPEPLLTEIEHDLLVGELEWQILFGHLAQYTNIIQSEVDEFNLPQQRGSDISIHKVCHFLHSLANSLSRFYSKVRVLVEPYSHLLPSLYSRIWLLRCVKLVMDHAFKLIHVQPLLSM